MAWRLHFSDRPIRRLELLAGKPPLLAAWTLPERVAFFDVMSGTRIDERTLVHHADTRVGDSAWRAHLATLVAQNKTVLPMVRMPQGTLYSTPEGEVRILARRAEGGFAYFEGSREQPFEYDGRVSAFAFSPRPAEPPVSVVLDGEGRVHVYRGALRTAQAEIGLRIREEMQPALAIAAEADVLVASDGTRLITADLTGRVLCTLDLYYAMGVAAISPDAAHIGVTDMESGVIRVYDAELRQTHQRFGIDLMADAKRAQLVTTGGVSGAAIGPLIFGPRGLLAFAMGGAVCVTSLARMKVLPNVPESVQDDPFDDAASYLPEPTVTADQGEPAPAKRSRPAAKAAAPAKPAPKPAPANAEPGAGANTGAKAADGETQPAPPVEAPAAKAAAPAKPAPKPAPANANMGASADARAGAKAADGDTQPAPPVEAPAAKAAAPAKPAPKPTPANAEPGASADARAGASANASTKTADGDTQPAPPVEAPAAKAAAPAKPAPKPAPANAEPGARAGANANASTKTADGDTQPAPPVEAPAAKAAAPAKPAPKPAPANAEPVANANTNTGANARSSSPFAPPPLTTPPAKSERTPPASPDVPEKPDA
jgi:hypothetical protein